MKKILFLVDFYSPFPTPNSVCVQNVARKLKELGWDVYINAYSIDNTHAINSDCDDDKFKLSFIRPNFSRCLLNKSQYEKNIKKSKLFRFFGLCLNRIRCVFMLPFNPIFSFSLSRRRCRFVSKIIKNENIDVVISVSVPNETLYSGYLIKKRNPSVKWIQYYIDSGTNLLAGSSFFNIKRLFQKNSIFIENKLLSLASKIIVMEGHSKYYKKNLSESNRSKLLIENVPLFSCSNKEIIKNKVSCKNKSKKIVYAGNLNNPLYNPKLLCTFFNNFSNYFDFQLHLYGPSNCESYLKEQEKISNGKIIWHGPVSHDSLEDEFMSADIFVYFINEKVDSISGKFFEYLNYKKPIIYIGPCEDINYYTLRNYPLGFFIDMNKIDDKKSYNDLAMFLNEGKNSIDIEKIKKTYNKFLPYTTAKDIDDFFINE